MQLTNSLVTICCNNVLSVTGGDLYISVMTIVSSIRQIIDTPIHAITEGSSPVISYNYGARRPKRVFQSWLTMSVMAILYTLLAWGVILFAPRFLIGIFSSDQALITDAIPALKLYFGAFVFRHSSMWDRRCSSHWARKNSRFSSLCFARSSSWFRLPTSFRICSIWEVTVSSSQNRYPMCLAEAPASS